MRPKLILLNGPLGIGKTTLAKRYAEEHPLTLCLDIDDIWAMISHWREQKEVSVPLSKQMALEMAKVNLLAGNDVIVPQILQSNELIDSFEEIAKSCDAKLYEILLNVDKHEAIERFIIRGKEAGYETGYRPGGTIDLGGREEKLAQMYDNMSEVAGNRPQVTKIEPILGDIDGTYAELMKALT